MEEGKHRKENDLTDTYNLFKFEELDDFTWLVTNLALEEKGFEDCSCWVVVNEQCKPGDIVLGKLSHHPDQSMKKGFPVLDIERYISHT